jgi:hypothetical protein
MVPDFGRFDRDAAGAEYDAGFPTFTDQTSFCNTALRKGMVADFQTPQGRGSKLKGISNVLTLVLLGVQNEAQADDNPFFVPESEGN